MNKFDITVSKDRNKILINLIDYSIPNINLIKEKIKSKVKTFSDWIDSWAIDFNHQKVYFISTWISYRTLKSRRLNLSSIVHTYNKQGKYCIAVKVNDILGNETIQEYEINID